MDIFYYQNSILDIQYYKKISIGFPCLICQMPLSINLFLHKRTSGERSRRHPVCILIAMAPRIFLYYAFSLVFIGFHWSLLIFIDFHWFFIDFHDLARKDSRTVRLSSRLVNRAWNLMRNPKNRVPEAKNQPNRFGSIRFGSIRFDSYNSDMGVVQDCAHQP